MSEDTKRDFSQYDLMSDEELEEILLADFRAYPDGEGPEMEVVLYATKVLTDRRMAAGDVGKSPEEAFEEFKKYYMPKSMKISMMLHKWAKPVATTAAAVLAVVIVGAATAGAFGFNVWDSIARWTQETFHFGEEMDESREPTEDYMLQLESLQEALQKRNDDPGILPTMVPAGFELEDLTMDESPKRRSYTAVYSKDEAFMQIVVQSLIGSRPQQVEQSEDVIEIYEKNEIPYYIISNYDQLRAVWVDGSYECYISGNVTVEELKMMIDSIEKG